MTLTVRISHPPPEGVPHAPDVVFRLPMAAGDWARDVSKTGEVSLQPKVFTRTWEKFAGEIKNHGVTGYLALLTLEERLVDRSKKQNDVKTKAREELDHMKEDHGLDPMMQLFPRDATIGSAAPPVFHNESQKQKALPDDVWENLEKQQKQYDRHVDAAYWVVFRLDVLRAVLFRFEVTSNVVPPPPKAVEKAIAESTGGPGAKQRYTDEQIKAAIKNALLELKEDGEESPKPWTVARRMTGSGPGKLGYTVKQANAHVTRLRSEVEAELKEEGNEEERK